MTHGSFTPSSERRRRPFGDEPQTVGEELPRDSGLRHLEGYIAAVASDLRADLDELLLAPSQRPVPDRLRCRQGAQEIAEIVDESVKQETDRVRGKHSARRAVPIDSLLALLDPLLAGAALIVEGDDPQGLTAQIGDDEANAGIKLAGVPYDIGNHPA